MPICAEICWVSRIPFRQSAKYCTLQQIQKYKNIFFQTDQFKVFLCKVKKGAKRDKITNVAHYKMQLISTFSVANLRKRLNFFWLCPISNCTKRGQFLFFLRSPISLHDSEQKTTNWTFKKGHGLISLQWILVSFKVLFIRVQSIYLAQFIGPTHLPRQVWEKTKKNPEAT